MHGLCIVLAATVLVQVTALPRSPQHLKTISWQPLNAAVITGL